MVCTPTVVRISFRAYGFMLDVTHSIMFFAILLTCCFGERSGTTSKYNALYTSMRLERMPLTSVPSSVMALLSLVHMRWIMVLIPTWTRRGRMGSSIPMCSKLHSSLTSADWKLYSYAVRKNRILSNTSALLVETNSWLRVGMAPSIC